MSSMPFNVGQLRGPWVPAPAKSSSTATLGAGKSTQKSMNKGFILPYPLVSAYRSSSQSHTSNKIKQKASVNLINSTSATKTKTKSSGALNVVSDQFKLRKENKQVIVRKPTSKLKKYGARRAATGYKLQSKDSLVDVTACLQAKRAEVMKIWQKFLQANDPVLLSLIEKTNRLSLEAAEEVEMLRRTIQDFQKKEDGMTDADCAALNEMRANVLLKVKDFEEVDNQLHNIIASKSESRTSIVSATSKTSQTENERVELPFEADKEILPKTSIPRPSVQDLLILKEKAKTFSAASQSDDSDDETSSTKLDKIRTNHEQQFQFQDKSMGTSASASLENFSHLNILYEEHLKFPQNDNIGLSRSQSCDNVGSGSGSGFRAQSGKINQQQRSVRFKEVVFKSDSKMPLDNTNSQSASSSDELYQQKISQLQRKLMVTEQEVEELKSEIERIESDANFRVRMLQNNVQDKFDSLSVLPEYLQMVELKISETAQVKYKLQQEVNDTTKLLSEERELSVKLKKENEELREKLRTAETTKELMTFKNYELEKSNIQLRKEIDDMAKKYTDMAEILRETDSFTSPRTPNRSTYQNWEVQKLKLQCSELKDKFSQSKRMIQSIRKSKEKMAAGLNEKIEELMEALQEAQHHKRILGEQIRFLKKSYHELFPSPPDLFDLNTQRKTFKTKISKHRGRRKPVIEPKVESKTTWETGTLKTAVDKDLQFSDDDDAPKGSKNPNNTYTLTPSENEESI